MHDACAVLKGFVRAGTPQMRIYEINDHIAIETGCLSRIWRRNQTMWDPLYYLQHITSFRLKKPA